MENSIKMLIADDDLDVAELIKNFFTANNFDCDVVYNGRDALSKIKEKKYDVILLDVMMPYIDGYHIAYEISNHQGDETPLIVILTARDIQFEKNIARMSGAFEIIQKPFNLDNLLSIVKRGLEERSKKEEE
ncbi:MAG: response regulator transcription factor [Elusimicrobiales bacterium]